MINNGKVEECQCGHYMFYIVIDNEYGLLLYECTKCGYVETNWFKEGE
jgi:uncharacterized Zn finger protein